MNCKYRFHGAEQKNKVLCFSSIHPSVIIMGLMTYSPERVPRQLGFRRFLGTWRFSARKKSERLSKGHWCKV